MKVKSFIFNIRLILTGMLIVSGMLPFITVPEKLFAVDWGLNDYAFRQSLSISHASGALTDYQVLIEVHAGTGSSSGNDVYLGNNAESWPDDIRFTTSDGATLIDFWVQQYDASTALVWVEFPSIGTSGTEYYIYYGYNSATSASNGTATFVQFDDMNRANSEAPGGIWTEVGGADADILNNALTITMNGAAGSGRYVGWPTTFNQNLAISANITMATPASGTRSNMLIIDETSSSNGIWGLGFEPSNILTQLHNGVLWANTGLGYTAGSPNIFTLTYLDSTRRAAAYKEATAAFSDKTGHSDGAWTTNLVAFAGDNNPANTATVDWIFARKFNATDPAFGSWGSVEEAPNTPTVSTANATSIGTTTATGNGDITSIGSSDVTERGFEWGTSSGTYTTSVTESGTFGIGTYSLTLTGLPSDDTIYYRAKAYNSQGWSYGSEVTFNTEAASPPSVTTGGATGFGRDYAVLTGTVTDLAGSTAITVIGVDYGLTDSYGSSYTFPTTLGLGDTFSVRIDGLTAATGYHYRAKVYNSDGAWGYGGDRVFYTHGGASIYEFWNTSDDAAVNIYGNSWYGQTFTTDADVPHTVDYLRAKLFRVGAPGILDYYIYRTDSNGLPTGAPIGHGDISADAFDTNSAGTWYTLLLDEETPLSTNTTYAVVLAATNGGASNYVGWRYDNGGGYSSGAEVTSTNGGASWSETSANDMMFEIWGNQSISITNARVFSDVLTSGDQLFVFLYNVQVDTETMNDLSTLYFNVQLKQNGVIKAQTKLPAWGFKPGSLYLAPDSAVAWGETLTTISITGISGTSYSDTTGEYQLSNSDWLGDNLFSLEDWVLAGARNIETWYNVPLVEFFGGTEQLNSTGTTMFTKGIPSLPLLIPNILEGVNLPSLPGKITHGSTYQDSLIGGFGARAIAAFDDIGTLIGVDGTMVGGIIWFWIFILFIGLMSLATNASIAFLVSLPILLVGGLMGIIPLVWLLGPAAVLIIYFLAKLTIWRGT